MCGVPLNGTSDEPQVSSARSPGAAGWIANEALALTNRFDLILDCIAMLTIAIAAMELTQTIVEEEFAHKTRLTAAAHARLVLSRFLVVVIVSLVIESLVPIFKLMHDDPSKISEAAFVAAALPVAWGIFIKHEPAGASAGGKRRWTELSQCCISDFFNQCSHTKPQCQRIAASMAASPSDRCWSE